MFAKQFWREASGVELRSELHDPSEAVKRRLVGH